MNTTLKVYLVTFTTKGEPANITRTVAVTSYDKKEAGDWFIKWAKANGYYDGIVCTVVQTAHKGKRNKHFYTEKLYKQQCSEIEELYKDYMKKAGN